VCEVAEEVATLVENEYQSGRDEGEEKAARRWVERRFTGRFDVEWRDGLLVATLPAGAFTSSDSLEPRRIGSFIKMDGWYFRIWCDDETLRHTALLDLADSYLGARAKIVPDEAVKRLARFCHQVNLGPSSPAEIANLARNAGKKALATQLDKLAGLLSPRWNDPYREGQPGWPGRVRARRERRLCDPGRAKHRPPQGLRNPNRAPLDTEGGWGVA
jgi:hypothetical protein